MQPRSCLKKRWAHQAKAAPLSKKAVSSWEAWRFAPTPLAPRAAPTHRAPELMGTDRWMSPGAPS